MKLKDIIFLIVAIIGFIVLAKFAPKGRCGSSCNSSFSVPVVEKTENVAVPKDNATNKTME